MNASKKSLILIALSGFAPFANATDVTSIGGYFTPGPQGWYISENSSQSNLAATPTNDGDGSLHFSGNNQAYVSFGAYPAYTGTVSPTFPSLGTLGGIVNGGSVSADLYRSSTSNTINPYIDVAVKLVFSGDRQLIWENADNANITTTDSWFNQVMSGSGLWYLRGQSTGGTRQSFDTAGNFQTLSAWLGGFKPAGYAGAAFGSTSDVLGYTMGFGSGVGTFDGAVDHLVVNYSGGTQNSFNFRAIQSTPEPASIVALGIGALALLRRRKRA